MTGGPSAAFYRGNWMKMNKQKTQHRWRKAATGLLALLLSFGMTCSAFAETAVGAGALRKSAAAGVQMVDAGMQDAAAQADNTPRRMENCVVKLDRYLAVCSGQAQTPKVLAVTYTYTREVSKPKPGGIGADKAGGSSGKGGNADKAGGISGKGGRADKVGEASVNIGEASVNIAGGK